MSWFQDRLDRLRRIVAILIQEGISPKHNLYGTRVMQIACGEFGIREQTAREYARTLGLAWERYRWIPYVRNNDYLSEEERENWIETHFKK